MQFGAAWCRLVQLGRNLCRRVCATWCRLVQPGQNLCRIVQPGADWCSFVQLRAVWCNLVQNGAVWLKLVQTGEVWCNCRLLQFSAICPSQVRQFVCACFYCVLDNVMDTRAL